MFVTHRIPAALAMEAVEYRSEGNRSIRLAVKPDFERRAPAAVTACTQQGYGVTATVIDADAQRIAVLRGDTAGVHSGENGVAACPVYGQAAAGHAPFQPPEHMIFRAGGLTIKLGDEVIGAIGVGGAPSAEADESCARAGLDKIRDRIR
jgi:uncharacterized protein GlcG (DUF336 family)